MVNGGTKRREDLCQKWFCAVKSNNWDVSRYLAFPMRCKSWDCPTCRRVKTVEYRSRMEAINDGRPLYMLTLTYYHNQSADDAWHYYNDSWNRLRTHISKKYGSFDYIRVLESHNDSPYPHLHIIMDMHVPDSEIGKMAISAGFGYQLRQGRLTSAEAFGYIRKYLTKEWTNEAGWAFRKKYRCRLISFSRGLLSPVRKSAGWETLIRGTDFESCLDHIRMDYVWNPAAVGKVTYEKVGIDVAEVTVIWTDKPPTDPFPQMDDWAPDDYVPK